MVLWQVTNMKEIILIGSYQMTKQLNRFITNVQQEFKIVIRYVSLQCFNLSYNRLLLSHPLNFPCRLWLFFFVFFIFIFICHNAHDFCFCFYLFIFSFDFMLAAHQFLIVSYVFVYHVVPQGRRTKIKDTGARNLWLLNAIGARNFIATRECGMVMYFQ